MFSVEYERQITTKLIVTTSAEPPRAKIENDGYAEPFVLCLIPSLSLPSLMLTGNVKFVSPLKNEVIKGTIHA